MALKIREIGSVCESKTITNGCGMLAQGVLGFQYEAETSSGGLTSLAGLPLYLDLIHASGLRAAIRQQVRVLLPRSPRTGPLSPLPGPAAQ